MIVFQRIILVNIIFIIGGLLLSTPFGAAFLHHHPKQQLAPPSLLSLALIDVTPFGCFSSLRRNRINQRKLCLQSTDNLEGSEAEDVVNITVSYEGELFPVSIQRGQENILNALERQRQLSSRVDLPSDCRRGNCLTCAARIITDDSSVLQQQLRSTDGLSPILSKFIREQGYLLTCSTYVVKSTKEACEERQPILELGANDKLWKKVYADRLVDEDVRIASQEAMARVIRRSVEDNIEEWTRETERLLQE